MPVKGMLSGALTVEERRFARQEAKKAVPPWLRRGLTRTEQVIAFCEDLTVTSGRDAGLKLVLRDWQKEFIEEAYRVDDDGKRVVRTAVLSMGRKNGKTQLAACLALCHLSGPACELRGEVYSCANDRFQASKIFHEMCAMIAVNTWLKARLHIIRNTKQIEDLENGSLYMALSKEAKTKMGLNPSFVVYDELGQSDSRELYDAMDSAMGAREEPMMLVISTQAADDAAPLSQLIDYGLSVGHGYVHDPTFHLTLYTAPDDADPWSERAWRASNPALGDFRSIDDVCRLADQAARMPSREPAFRNLILNQRVASEVRFIEPSAWKACSGAPHIVPGTKVYAGLDLGSTRDMSALALAAQDPLSGEVSVVLYCWMPGDLRERGNEDGAPYDEWARRGLLFPSGTATDPRVVARKIAQLAGEYRIVELAYDRWRITEMRRELDAVGCRVPLVDHGQGYKDMGPAVDALDRLVMTEKLRHGGNPILTWSANNAVVTRDPAGNRKFDKSSSKYQSRIDPLVATAMAISLVVVKQQSSPAFDAATLIA
jgi:phage terminase large subunit-like protein